MNALIILGSGILLMVGGALTKGDSIRSATQQSVMIIAGVVVILGFGGLIVGP